MPADPLDPGSLAPLVRPYSIAVIGASTEPTKLGSVPVGHMKASGFAGALYPINPKAATVQGLPAYPSVGAVPGPVDLAIIAVPEAQVLAAMRDCAGKGVRAAVIFTSGFAELGEAGQRAQAEMVAIAREAKMRLLGPNCMGLINFSNRMVATFHPAFGPTLAPSGRIGLVTQSGAFGGFAYQMAQDKKLGYSLILTTGNEGDVDIADGLAHLADDPNTAVILLYIEGCRDGAKLAAALARARAQRKPVICLKVGRTDAGMAAVASHTAALAGTDEIFDAMFRQHGVHRASTMEEFLDIGYAVAETGELPRDRSIGIVTVSGGVGVLMADSAAAYGLDVKPAPERLQERIRAMVPFAATRNPIDVTGQMVNDFDILPRALEMVLEDGGYTSTACFVGFTGRSVTNGPRFTAAIARLRLRFPEQLLAVTARASPEFRAALEAAACLLFDEPTHAMRAIAALVRFRESFDAVKASTAPPLPKRETLPLGPLDEVQSLALLRRAGIPVVPHRLVESARAAGAAAAELGLPAVLKIVSPDIAHKTDIGGVALGLDSAAAVGRAFDAVTARVKARQPDARIKGCLVAPMAPVGVETILGVQWDPVFGPVVMLGLGGIFVEALKDVTFRLAPFDEAEARRMIGELRGAAVLGGLRGRPAADIDALARTLAALSCFAAAQGPTLKSLDINPLLVLPEGQGALALDAVIVPA